MSQQSPTRGEILSTDCVCVTELIAFGKGVKVIYSAGFYRWMYINFYYLLFASFCGCYFLFLCLCVLCFKSTEYQQDAFYCQEVKRIWLNIYNVAINGTLICHR